MTKENHRKTSPRNRMNTKCTGDLLRPMPSGVSILGNRFFSISLLTFRLSCSFENTELFPCDLQFCWSSSSLLHRYLDNSTSLPRHSNKTTEKLILMVYQSFSSFMFSVCVVVNQFTRSDGINQIWSNKY